MLRPEDCIPGTLVECIDASNNVPESKAPPLVERRIYRLASGVVPFTRPDAHERFLGTPSVLVEEIPGWGCGLFRFRLLPDERLSIFRQMLAPAPKQKEGA